MKNILNLVLGIKSGHFYKCPHMRGLNNVNEDPNCFCREKCYRLVISIGLSMFVLELVGGKLTNSLSLIGDSLHLFADTISAIVGIIVDKSISENPSKKTRYRKRGVLINASTLLFSASYLFWESFQKFLYPCETSGGMMTGIAVIGLTGNFFQYYLLVSIKGNKEEKDPVLSSIIMHFFTDVLQSIAVIIGGICLIFITDFNQARLIDPMLSTGIAFLMGFAAIGFLLEVLVPDDGHDHSGQSHHHH